MLSDIAELTLEWYDWLLMGISVVIIILCLIQGGKTEGASGAITGGGLNVFVKTKERGAEKVLSILTLLCVITFFVIAILIKVIPEEAATVTSETSSSLVL